VKQQYICETDLQQVVTYELVCDGCDWRDRWDRSPDQRRCDVVVIARRRGWERLEVNGGMRTFCAGCAEEAKQGDALAEEDASFWLEDGGTH
jgi:hypothetical protein